MKTMRILMTGTVLWAWSELAHAQYVVLLKNGRQLTVQSYREEGSTVKIQGLGGEMGIPKDQIQSISKSGQSDRPGVNLSNLETSSRAAPAPTPPKPAPAVASGGSTESSGPAGSAPGVSAAEEKEYRRRLAEVSQKLEAARQRYYEATQGGGSGSNVSKEGLRSWTMDLASRIQDSHTKVKGDGGAASTPPMPPLLPGYHPKTKELSDIRAEIDQLEKERNELIQEIKSKGLEAS
jgi:hypothetical protein